VRERRDHDAVRTRLEALKQEARGTGNLIPRLLDCAGVHTSLGEISAALTEVFGEYREQPFF
jgi:methylmalonyl-CoA mutase N-terminal domain/subunit